MMIALKEPYRYAVQALYRYNHKYSERNAGLMVISMILKYDENASALDARIIRRLYYRLIEKNAERKQVNESEN